MKNTEKKGLPVYARVMAFVLCLLMVAGVVFGTLYAVLG